MKKGGLPKVTYLEMGFAILVRNVLSSKFVQSVFLLKKRLLVEFVKYKKYMQRNLQI